MQTIGGALAEQFERMWMMLAETIGNCSGWDWRRDAGHWLLIPGRLAYHIMETVEYYSRESPDETPRAERFGVDWETRELEKLPDRKLLLDCLGEVRGRLLSKLCSASDEAMLADHPFPWTGKTLMELMMYALRHSMFHLGEIQSELRRRQLRGAEWH